MQLHKYDRLDQKSIKRKNRQGGTSVELENTASSGITRYTVSKGQEKVVSGTREGWWVRDIKKRGGRDNGRINERIKLTT